MEQTNLDNLLKEAKAVQSFLTARLDEAKNWRRSENMLEQVGTIFAQQVKFLQGGNKQVADLEQDIESLNAKRAELIEEVQPLRDRCAAEQAALRAARQERDNVIAGLDRQIAERSAKLAHIEAEITKRAAVLGQAIAAELI